MPTAERTATTNWEGDLAHGLRTSGAHALGSLISDNGIMDCLGAFAIFDEREFDFQFALAVALSVFNRKLHK